MMTTQQILTVYKAMATLTGQMLEAASHSDWERLEVLEQRCAAHVRLLQQQEPATALPPQGRAEKAAMIKQMLSDDKQIRELTTPWMAHLAAMINSTGAERRLAGAYGRV